MEIISLINLVEVFVQEKLSDADSGHDWWHVERARKTARRLHLQEGGDWLVIELAVLLHDVGDRKVIKQHDDNYSIAENFLIKQRVDTTRVEQVMSIIKTMSFSKSFDKIEKDDSIEFKIVQDADRLDAVGAIGVARAFAYGGSKDRPLYDPTYEAQTFESSEAYKNAQGSTIHHFYEKLFLLKDNLNTNSAKKIAVARDAFMHEFVEQFLGEWDGKR